MDIFDQLSDGARADCAKRVVRKAFTKGSPVIGRGDPVSGAYFVAAGELRVFTVNAEGKETTLYRIGPGDTCVLALNSLFSDLLYPAWVEADRDTEIAVVPGPLYRELFRTEPAIQETTMRALCSTVFGLMAEIEQRHAQTLDQRLAGYLMLRASSAGEIRNTQQEIASEIGTTREVVGRIMSRLARRGVVKTARGVVTIKDKAALNALAKPDGDLDA